MVSLMLMCRGLEPGLGPGALAVNFRGGCLHLPFLMSPLLASVFTIESELLMDPYPMLADGADIGRS